MDENTDRKTDKRLANLKPPWQPGKCVNPKGRPRGNISLTSLIKRTLKETCEADPQKRTWAEAFSRSLIANAIKGNGSAIKEILARVDGAIPTVIEGGDKDKPIIVKHAEDPEADRLARELVTCLARGAKITGGSGVDSE